MTLHDLGKLEHGLDEWTDGYIDGFEEAFEVLCEMGVVNNQIFEKFATRTGLSADARARLMRIVAKAMLERTVPK